MNRSYGRIEIEVYCDNTYSPISYNFLMFAVLAYFKGTYGIREDYRRDIS